jgi:cytochrome c oxidase cbb3-type subunit 3/ubiquinol-cytochrome c reductase cytochrome c subunit
MNCRVPILAMLACTACLAGLGCEAPGKPVHAEASRPGDVLDFSTLYNQNCVACHGRDGKGGATLPLSNPVYLEVAGADDIQRITASGVSGTSMPPFAKARGGTLSDRQIAVLTKGIIDSWEHADSGQLIPYASTTPGDPANGKAAYMTFCARCHGVDGIGTKGDSGAVTGSIVDPAYLALVSNQYLRSTIIAGLPDRNMPDWRLDLPAPGARAMTDQEVTDTVAWITSHRIAAPGQPYAQHP